MPPKDLAIVILAAGKGTRLKSNLAKVLHRAGGRALIEQVLRACAPLGAKKTVVVVGHQAEQVWTSPNLLARPPSCNSRNTVPGTPCK
jgi:bifunctional N-acetylglucosamine-1-phosphate-uridyltransferase/glucosamine-1-phosphate-acetyltransferase GlmU-like protein